MFLGLLFIALIPIYLIQMIIQNKQEADYRQSDLSGQQRIKA
jgi:hypothetical protein